MKRGLSLLIYPVFLASCASNDELFAEYDELNICGKCNNKIEMSMVNATAMPETFIWEPAVYFGFDLDYLELLHSYYSLNLMNLLLLLPACFE